MRILLIDDYEPIRDVLTEALTREGHTVIGVGTMEDAAVVLDLDHLDAVITDGEFPRAAGLTPHDYGLTVAQVCRLRGLPCVLHTGSADIADLGRRMGFAVVGKGAGIEEILGALGMRAESWDHEPSGCPHCARRAPVHAAGFGA